LRHNWPDETSGKVWDKDGNAIDKAARAAKSDG